MTPCCSTRKRCSRASSRASRFERSRPLANAASSTGEVTPSSNASSTAREVFDHTCEATEVSLIPAPCCTFSSRWITRTRSWDTAVRARVRSRSSRNTCTGTKDGRTSPHSRIRAIHTESPTSVLRPGTLRRCAALTSQQVNRPSKEAKTGFQYTPVASIPTAPPLRRPASHPARPAPAWRS